MKKWIIILIVVFSSGLLRLAFSEENPDASKANEELYNNVKKHSPLGDKSQIDKYKDFSIKKKSSSSNSSLSDNKSSGIEPSDDGNTKPALKNTDKKQSPSPSEDEINVDYSLKDYRFSDKDGNNNNILDFNEKGAQIILQFDMISETKNIKFKKPWYISIKPSEMDIIPEDNPNPVFNISLNSRTVKRLFSRITILINDKNVTTISIPLDSKFYSTISEGILSSSLYFKKENIRRETISYKDKKGELIVELSLHSFFRSTVKSAQFSLSIEPALKDYLIIKEIESPKEIKDIIPGLKVVISYPISSIKIPSSFKKDFIIFYPKVIVKNKTYSLKPVKLFIQKPSMSLFILLIIIIPGVLLVAALVIIFIKNMPVKGDFSIIALDEKAENRIFRLIQDELTVGRSVEGDNTIKVNDPHISNKHALFKRSKKGYELVDLNSRNGTFVNDTKIKQVLLKNGDIVRFYNIKYKFQFSKK